MALLYITTMKGTDYTFWVYLGTISMTSWIVASS